jgi:hypothetical protein
VEGVGNLHVLIDKSEMISLPEMKKMDSEELPVDSDPDGTGRHDPHH